jgi:hypothetical protein
VDTAALAGLIGAVIGGVATLAGSAVTSRLQARLEAVKWARDRKAEAYDSTIRYFLRAANRRSEFSAEGGPYVAKAQVGEFFDDLVEAQYWLAVLTTLCGEGQRERERDSPRRRRGSAASSKPWPVGVLPHFHVTSTHRGALASRATTRSFWPARARNRRRLRQRAPELGDACTAHVVAKAVQRLERRPSRSRGPPSGPVADATSVRP